MELSGFTAGLSAYVTFFLGFCARYFGILGALYWVLQIGFRQKWLVRRIQPEFPALRDVGHEIRWSMANGAFTGLSALMLYHLIHGGATAMYAHVSDYGWPYFLSSIVLGIAGYETWNYWGHRLLHTPWLFRHVHWAHHVTNPSVFASFARHPAEALVEQGFYILWIIFVPVHPMAIACVMLFFFANGVIAHTGYEFYPRHVRRYPLLRWLNTSTYHNMHHQFEACNYTTALNLWDRWMGTDHRAYDGTFAAIKARLGEPATIRLRAMSSEGPVGA